MGKLLAAVGAFLGAFVALTSTGMCWGAVWDEVELPESLR